MTQFTLLKQSWRHYWRWHLGLAAAVAIAAGVISGSLAVGDSLRATLANQAAERLGRVQTALIGNDRFFTEPLATALGDPASGIIVVRGTVAKTDGTSRAGDVNILGVPETFWSLAKQPLSTPAFTADQEDVAAANEALMHALGVNAGEDVLIRVEKPGALSKDAPLAGEVNQTATVRATLTAPISGPAFGNFSLNANQTTPRNLFVPLARLQAALELPERVNVALAASAQDNEEAIARAWTLNDVGLTVTQPQPNGSWVLESSRVFFDPALAEAVHTLFPEAQGVLTYLVNDIRGPGPKRTPYSMATATNDFGLQDNETLLTQWTADDIGAQVGDTITISYYQVGRARQMTTQEASFVVKDILPMDHPAVRPEWTPAFPGVMDTPSCRDWEPGIAMDMTKIRPEDETYWETYKGTPKLFVSLPAGQQLWGNRFGQLTSLRVPAASLASPEDFTEKLRAHLGRDALRVFGLTAARPADTAQAAVEGAYDLGGLFLAMSFFLIATALWLVALLFLFNVESRTTQLGLLRAIGIHPTRVRRLLTAEAAIAAVAGAALGLPLGVLYTQTVLHALSGEWSGAVGGLAFVADFRPATLVAASFAAVLMATVTAWFAARRWLQREPRELLAGVSADKTMKVPTRWSRASGPLAITSLLAATALAVTAPSEGQPLIFFGAGSLLMLAGVLVLNAQLRRWRQAASRTPLATAWQLGRRNTARRAGRSLALAGLLAAGVFMISSMDAFRLDAQQDAENPASGTGGFTFIGETTLPIYEDLNTPTGLEAFALEPEDVPGTRFVGLRVREGDEASCLNLQRPQNPRVLGVAPSALEGHFTFAAGAASWQVLEGWTETEPVPTVMDANYVRYTLKAQLGDTLSLADGRGGEVKLRIAALLEPSVLQGSAVIAEEVFEKLFPEQGGYRFFLINTPPATAQDTAAQLSKMLENRGLSLTPAANRLNEYHAVQNTYLRIFSALGGLGLILSTAGLGLMLARSVLERRAEFGLLQSIGFQSAFLRHVVVGENAFLLVWGLLTGIAAALVAVWPVSQGASLPALTLVAIFVGGLLFCTLAAWFALRGKLVEAVRTE